MATLSKAEILDWLDGEISFPSGISFDRKKSFFYITCMNNGAVCYIDCKNRCNGIFSNQIRQGRVNGILKKPLALTVSADGELFIADAVLNDIFKLSKDGVFESVLYRYHQRPELWTEDEPAFNLPGGVAVNDRGELFVTDFLNNRIRKIDCSGIVSTVAGPSNGKGDIFDISKPYGICFSLGRFYLTNTGKHSILCIEEDGKTLSAVKLPSSDSFEPIAIAANPSGKLYISEQRRLFCADPVYLELSELINRDIWAELSQKFSLTKRICHIGAVCAPENGGCYWIDTIKGYVAKASLD
jgi:hypothetical protein